MFKVIKKELNFSIVTSVIFVVLGMLLMFYPDRILGNVAFVIAILALAYGFIITAINFSELSSGGNPMLGVLLIISGIALLMYPKSLGVLVAMVVGIWFISDSVNRIKIAVILRDAKEPSWLLLFLVSVVSLIAGITFIFAPLESAIALTMLVGALMVFYSLFDIFGSVLIRRNFDAIEKALEDAKKGME
jgi:uncharacterized membrane protein HdeD (DUF308 family)